MKLKDLLSSVKIEFDKDIEVKGITCNSNNIKPNYLFIATKGNLYDGNEFINEAFNKKACFVISDSIEKENVMKIENIKEIKADIFYSFYGYPQQKLKIIGVTGTNGKTSTAMILYNLLNNLGVRSMYIGTLGVFDGNYKKMLNNTTPDCDILSEELYKAVKRKTKYVIMEVSSHSLSLNRIKYIDFIGAIFTNLTHEHLDYHQTMDNYLLAKQKLFNDLKDNAFAIINYDDKYHNDIIRNSKANIVYYGVESSKNKISNISRSLDGISFDIDGIFNINSKLLGVINVYNLSAALLCLVELGFDKEEIIREIAHLNTINGRLEKVYNDKYCIILDYAHTPDAMEKVLLEVKPLVANRLIVLFGCGGNRDATKRSIMGGIATNYADIVYITSDNPRFEEPFAIIKDILKGCDNYKKIVIEESREMAIRKALLEIEDGDILMILGKGHEEYQIIGNEHISFSDKEMIKKWQ